MGKRSACDRCRTQKLGCMRVHGHPTDACLRCVRSQVECVTSSSRRPGRPTKAAAVASTTTTMTTEGLSSSSPPPQRHDSCYYAPAVLDVDDTLDFAALDLPCEIPSSFWGLTDALANHSSTAAGDEYCFLDSAIGDDRSPSTTNLELAPSSADHAGPLRKHRMQLAHVHQSLYEQLLCLQSSSHCDLTEVLRVTCVQHHHMKSSSESPRTCSSDSTGAGPATTICACPSPSPSSNPRATVTTIAAEFVDILSVLMSPALVGSGASSQPNNPHLSTPDLLLILACYILLIHIYDGIFAQLLDQATTDSSALDTALQSAPVLSLGGIAVPPARHLPAHPLLVLFNRQIRPIEALLGLPDSLRVSDAKQAGGGPQPGRGTGQDHRGGGLFSGAGGQTLCMGLVQVEIEQAVGGTCGLGVFVALREKRARVLVL
ncbi:hypothetical protein BJX61DRAFT_540216 [Aspergillus egyptiacus]|nr:hypothetical protein BJX61DRAFT_540216 [Aspergillus egyptiacus]